MTDDIQGDLSVCLRSERFKRLMFRCCHFSLLWLKRFWAPVALAATAVTQMLWVESQAPDSLHVVGSLETRCVIDAVHLRLNYVKCCCCLTEHVRAQTLCYEL